jgi:GMP synthase (glutamine-hydrolysing)
METNHFTPHKPFGILVTGSPIKTVLLMRGGFDALIREAAGSAWVGSWEVVDCESEPIPALDCFAGVIVTGSPKSVMDCDPWMLRLQERLREAVVAGGFVLGICFGHQILAEALGGRVSRNPRGTELGLMPLELIEADELLSTQTVPATVYMAHDESVIIPPPGARVLARTESEPHAALRMGPRAWGVQYHPEFDASVMREYIIESQEEVPGDGWSADGWALDLEHTDPPAPASDSGVIARFLSSVGSRTPRVGAPRGVQDHGE